MRRLPGVLRSSSRFVLCLVGSLSGFAQQPKPAVDEVLARVRANIAALQASIPSFSCDEQIDSQLLSKGKIKDEMKIDSEFRMVREPSESASIGGLAESRVHKTVNDHPVMDQSDAPPFSLYGGYANMLDFVGLASCMDYQLEAAPAAAPAGAILLNGSQNKDIGAECSSTRAYVINAVLDGTSLDLLHADFTTQDVNFGKIASTLPTVAAPFTSNTMKVSVDYAPVELGGTSFQLPKRIVADVEDHKKPLKYHYVAAYNSCRRYTASARIIPDEDPR